MYHYGIEIYPFPFLFIVIVGFNCTIMELKSKLVKHSEWQGESFNCTIMELKSVQVSIMGDPRLSFNCTIMELKYDKQETTETVQ